MPAPTTQRHEIARDLRRSTPFTIRAEAPAADEPADDGLTLEGDAAVFNTPTLIDSWEGRFKELLVPGSFKKTLRETTPKLQFDHGSHPLIGSIPIGTLTSAYEDGDRAVHVTARLSDNWLVQPVREAIAAGAIDGMSFRFNVIREEWRNSDGKALKIDEVISRLWDSYDVDEDELMTRHIKELRCQELGPVVFPAYADTTVGVRSITIDLGRLAEPEQRSKLARAVMLADLAERQDSDSEDESADAPPDQAPVTETPESTDAPLVAGHPSDTPSSDDQRSDPAAEILASMRSTLARIQRSN